ncbi:NAD(P)-dependent alcohol dehydrogenase [Glycomyces sp. L485]|uniref:NAD(P)-dependent alcohol dehydrogenase n=1 Tax=Glycomyces sp. L485 TaxID=2909235 RepID=UPI001F4ACB01|nr:NAD(P)-dependent alcohol dehydrogenase [Glycomyces sp. L485]MCH7232309.1 NAD(P)-dependent alcohol dehydrogenase [Glycomyces sp. L485]
MQQAMMRAVQFDRYGPPEVLGVREAPRPVPKAGEVLVKVHAVSVNPVDSKIRSGSLRLLTGRRFPRSIGVDFAGEVVGLGPGVDEALAGKAVWGATKPLSIGVTAEYLAVDARWCGPAPSGVDSAGAAALPLVGISAVMALDAVAIESGMRLLVVGASGGTGNAVAQIAAAKGARVATVSSRANLDFCREYGAEEAYAYDTGDDLGGRRFDAIVDLVGTAVDRHRGLLRPDGRMATPAVKGMPAAYASALLPGPRVRVVQMRPGRAHLDRLAAHVERGELRPVIGRFYALDEIVEAHRSMDTGHSRGKRVILIAD